MTALAYADIIMPLTHLHNVTLLPLGVGHCFNKELLHSLDLVRQSLFRQEDMSNIKEGVEDVKGGFEVVETERNTFRDAVLGIIEWLDDTFISCDKIKSKPYEVCLRVE